MIIMIIIMQDGPYTSRQPTYLVEVRVSVNRPLNNAPDSLERVVHVQVVPVQHVAQGLTGPKPPRVHHDLLQDVDRLVEGQMAHIAR